MTGPGPGRLRRARRTLSLRRHLSLRRRLAVIAAMAVAVAVALVAAAAYLSSRGTLLSEVDATLQSQAQVLEQSPPVALSTDRNPLLALVPALQVVGPDGSYESLNPSGVTLPVSPADIAVARGQQGQVLRDVTVNGHQLRMITVPYGSNLALQLTRSLADVTHALHRLAVTLALLTLAGVAVAISGGMAVARAGLAPVGDLTRAVERVARTDQLGPPLPVEGPPGDEVARLAASVNGMLAALAVSRERQRQLVADAGHELRTPLTSLRTNIELLTRADAADRPLPPEDRARLLADLTGQTEELATLVGELTALARDEAPEEEPEPLDLAEVVAGAVERVRRRAGGLTLITELTPTPVEGRRGQLERAVLNLLDNAVKWSPPGGEIYVGLQDRQLVVADQGPGVPAEDLPRVFERFYRSPTARGLPGSGLGLAIVADAARQHGGGVSLERGPNGGTLARLTLPPA